jgi:hypothetical protein
MKLPKLIVGFKRESRSDEERQDRVLPQGCNPFTCGAKVIACATACLSGVGTIGCITCLGSAYDSCKDCF